MGTKFIRNTDDASIVCRIPSDKNKVFNFRCKKFDKRNNILLSNGYTEVADEDLALLKAESKAFIAYEKTGKLTVVDSLPQDSMSTEQLISSLKSEVAALKNELKKAPKGEDSSESLRAALETVTGMSEEMAKLKDKIAAQERMIEALDTQLAETYSELAEVGKE